MAGRHHAVGAAGTLFRPRICSKAGQRLDRLANEEFDYYDSGALKWKQERDDSGNLSKTYFEYDDLGRRTGTDYGYDGTFDADVSFEYEGGSELVTTVHEAGGLGDTVYAYDDHGRLKTYEPPKPSGFATWYKLEYEYNALGAKTKMTLTLPSGAKNVGQSGDVQRASRKPYMDQVSFGIP